MNYHLQPGSTKSAYLQLYELLRKDITSGIFPYGAKLPSKRLMAEELGISVITVEHAYNILCDEGYVEARQRSGYYAAYRQGDLLSFPQEAAEPTEKAAPSNSHAPFPFSQLARTMRRVLQDYGQQLLIKSPNHGCSELRTAISAYLRRSCGMDVSPRQIIIGSGAEYLYGLLLQLLGSNRPYALEDPSYPQIRRVYEANGICCRMLKMGSDGILSSQLHSTDAGVLHVTPFHSYPSGVTASASKRTEYLAWANRTGGYIIEDNFDSELTVSAKNEDTLFSLSGGSQVIYLNTFSRTIAPSMRVGYLVLPEELLPKFEETLGFYSCTVPVFEQYVLAQLISDGSFERHINRIRRQRRKAK